MAVGWLRRVLPGSSAPEETPERESAPARVERAAPGVAALFDEVSEDRSHAVLDLGPAADSSLRIYSRFASRVRFVDLLSAALSPEGSAAALESVPRQPERPYDLVFLWDALDRLLGEDRRRLVERLVQVTAPHARLHLLTESPDTGPRPPLRFSLVDVDRIRQQPTGPARPARRPLLPAEVERQMAPFRVVHGFTLKGGLREYVAVRDDG